MVKRELAKILATIGTDYTPNLSGLAKFWQGKFGHTKQTLSFIDMLS